MIRPTFLIVLFAVIVASGCQTTGGGGISASNSAARKAMVDAIALEPRGAYYVGRRYYKTDYKFWGYVRKAGEPWSAAKLVMMNENSKLAPDRQGGRIGSDNNYEYKLFGNFSGQLVYEPASNSFYPEFVLKGAELLTVAPGPIYRDANATNPDRRVIPKPY
jgi:hypothetical protein